jgi:hypothetical protein
MNATQIVSDFLETVFRQRVSIVPLSHFANDAMNREKCEEIMVAIDECLFTLKPTELDELVHKNVTFAEDIQIDSVLWLKQTRHLISKFLLNPTTAPQAKEENQTQ